MITLRPYQSIAVARILHGLKKGLKVCLALPPQCGKTVTAFETISQYLNIYGGKVLFVTPRKFITLQGKDEAVDYFGEEKVGYVNSKVSDKELLQIIKTKTIIMGDLITMKNRLSKKIINKNTFGLVIADEGHYSLEQVNEVKSELLNFKEFDITATPHDHNGKYLTHWDLIEDSFDASYMVNDGFLARLILYHADIYSKNRKAVQSYSSHLRTGVNGDYTSGSLAKATNSKAGKILTNMMIDYTFKNELVSVGERALVYAGSVEQAEELAWEFKRRGHNSVCVHSKVKDSLEQISKFNNGYFDVLISVDMLIMGVVVKNAKKSLFFRGISSRITYQQVSNRGRGGDRRATKIPNVHYHFTDTFEKMGHPDDFRPHHNENKIKKAPECKKCSANLSEIPMKIVSMKRDGNFIYAIKECLVCGDRIETQRTDTPANLHEGTFSMVQGQRVKDIQQKVVKHKKVVQSKAYDKVLNSRVAELENILTSKGIESKALPNFFRKKGTALLKEDKNFMRNFNGVLSNMKKNHILLIKSESKIRELSKIKV